MNRPRGGRFTRYQPMMTAEIAAAATAVSLEQLLERMNVLHGEGLASMWVPAVQG